MKITRRQLRQILLEAAANEEICATGFVQKTDSFNILKLLEADIIDLDAFRKTQPGSEDSFSGESEHAAKDRDIIHEDIVSSVFDEVEDQIFGKDSNERDNIILSAIDTYIEQNEDVDMKIIDLKQVFRDVIETVDMIEMQKTKFAAGEQGNPEQEMEDEIEALMWSHGAKPATIEENVVIDREILVNLIKEELAIFIELSDDEEFPDSTDAWHPSEIVPHEDVWSGGDNIDSPVDHAYYETGESNSGPHDSASWSHAKSDDEEKHLCDSQ